MLKTKRTHARLGAGVVESGQRVHGLDLETQDLRSRHTAGLEKSSCPVGVRGFESHPPHQPPYPAVGIAVFSSKHGSQRRMVIEKVPSYRVSYS